MISALQVLGRLFHGTVRLNVLNRVVVNLPAEGREAGIRCAACILHAESKAGAFGVVPPRVPGI